MLVIRKIQSGTALF